MHIARERGEPVELVGVVRVIQCAAVRHVQAPQAQAFDRRADRARLDGKVGAVVALQEPGLPGEADLDILDRQARRDRDAVPLVESVQNHLVAGVLERLHRELLGLALDLLEGDDIDVLAHHPVEGSGIARADRVDVPGGDAHGSTLAVADRRMRAIQAPEPSIGS